MHTSIQRTVVYATDIHVQTFNAVLGCNSRNYGNRQSNQYATDRDIFTVRLHNATHGIAKAILSVCLSVRLPSDKRVNYHKTKGNCAHFLIPHERSFILLFW